MGNQIQMDQMSALMVKLIGHALFQRPVDHDELRMLSQADYDRLFRLSAHQDLAHLIGYALQEQGSFPPNCPAEDRFQQKYLASLYRCTTMDIELAAIKQLFTGANIPFILLKGAVIRSFYPEPWMRTSSDMDILIHDSDVDRAFELLTQELHYTSDGKRYYHDMELRSPNGVLLELHFSIMENLPSMDQILADVWQYAGQTSPDSCEYKLDPTFFMFYLTAHMAYHFGEGGCGIRPFIDFYICRQMVPFDRGELLQLCRTATIDTFLKAVDKAVDVWFDQDTPDEMTNRIGMYVVNGGIHGDPEKQMAVRLKKNGSKAHYIGKRIFMPYQLLKTKYPRLERHKWLLPYYEVKRWATLISEHRVNEAVSEWERVSDANVEDQASTLDLMKRLNL